MKKKSVFRIAAERIHNGYSQGCCGAIESASDVGGLFGWFSLKPYFFKIYFKPTKAEMRKFNTKNPYWMASSTQTHEQDQNDRILALLICEQIWLSEQNK